MKTFTCPKCGGHHYGRDMRQDEHGDIQVLTTVRCHNEVAGADGITRPCNWCGLWSDATKEVSDATDDRPRSIALTNEQLQTAVLEYIGRHHPNAMLPGAHKFDFSWNASAATQRITCEVVQREPVSTVQGEVQ